MPNGDLWSATARASQLNRDGDFDFRDTVSHVRANYRALEFGWKGRMFGEAFSLDLGVESLGWSTLAGIGEVESVHGTLDGRTLLADGRPSQPIIGPTLDGRGPVAAIRASSSATALHGDPTWDHAVGPLQFLPSTWAHWGGDGDGDGAADPQDLDDAAYAVSKPEMMENSVASLGLNGADIGAMRPLRTQAMICHWLTRST